MFGFFKKSAMPAKTGAEKRAEELPRCKKVQFEAVPLKQAEAELDADLTAVLKYVPVNYYATKEKYLLCIFYYSDDYGEIFMRLEYRVDDLPRGKTKLWSIDKELMRGVLRKFGQNI